MPDFVISDFQGLNTRKEDSANGISLPAKIANNCDLRGGVIKPFNRDKVVSPGHTGEIVKYGQDYYSGKEGYVTMVINGYEMLLYKDEGKWKRMVRVATGQTGQYPAITSLSQPIPATPAIQPLANDPNKVKGESATDGWFYEMQYCITYTREIDGYRDESAPSAFDVAQNDVLAFRIRRPTASGAGVKYWTIYRLSTGYRATGAFQKVIEVPIGSDFYDDYLLGSDLQGVLSGLFDEQGVTVLRQPAPVEFDGICKNQYYGQTVGWKDEVLYVSEPNMPESYPAQYQLRCRDKIIGAECFQGDLYAFTESGVQRIVGSNPTSASILPDYVGYRVANKRSVISTEMGLFYVYKTGIARLGDGPNDSISRNWLSPEYFQEINMASVHLAYGDGVLFMFHDKGTLLYMPERGIGFITLNVVYEGSFYDRKDGVMLVTKDFWAHELWQGTAPHTFEYMMDGLVLNHPDDKSFEVLEFYGTGLLKLTLYLDKAVSNERTLDLDGIRRERIIGFPYGTMAREASWKISGTGQVTEMKAVLNG